jgi:hypothetical protein
MERRKDGQCFKHGSQTQIHSRDTQEKKSLRATQGVKNIYSVFHQLRQAKFAYGGSILSSSQFLLLPQKMELTIKVVKVDSKIVITLPEI